MICLLNPNRNRNGWKAPKEQRQNRAMAWCSPWLVDIIYSRLVGWKILDPDHFKEHRMTYSSVWIDSNTSWKECDSKRPKETCARQGVSIAHRLFSTKLIYLL